MKEHSRDDAAGAKRLTRAVRAARELSETVWDCLQEQIPGADHTRARALAERLAEVSATVALLLETEARAEVQADARAVAADRSANDTVRTASDADRWSRGEQVLEPRRSVLEPRSAPEPPDGLELASSRPERRTPPEPVAPTAESPGTRILDEQGPTATVTPFFGRSAAQSPPSSAPAGQWPSSSVSAGQWPRSSARDGDADVEIRDARREEGPSAWISSVGQMLARHSQDRLPFAVLLVEIVDVAHLERSETPHELHGLVAQVESALGRGMRATDELSRETLGRYWLLAPETDGAGARTLAERLALLVRSSASHRGAPMEVAIGIAVCPEDGIEAPALAARADLGVYSARATGRSIAHTEPPVR